MSYYIHKTTGVLWFDPLKGTKHFKPWWVLLKTQEDIIDFYRWFLKKKGIQTMPNKLWGPHVSVVKSQEPENKELWGQEGTIEMFHTNVIRFDNNKHAWLDVFCPEMYDLRLKLGLPGKSFYHMTLGQLQ